MVIDADCSPSGKRTYVFWNPPRVRDRRYRSRRSANVEACDLMAELVSREVPTITFSKAKITSELIYRYVVEALEQRAPHLARKVTAYRGGYLAAERREIERKLFAGELLGVSTTRALELGIDIGGIDACIVVGYPGQLASFFQQSGRAGRRERESLAVLVGLDTAVNQYVMNHPEYVFGQPIERIVLDPDNPYVLSGQLRCAASELPISEAEVERFGQYARLVLDVLTEQRKLNKVGDRWYHACADVPQHEVGLRDMCDANVAITDVDTGRVIGELNMFDAQSLIHLEAIYIHQGETYLVLELDLVCNQCLVKKVVTDYYTQPLGGTDVHHIDQPLRMRNFGTAKAYFGEVTSYFSTHAYERIHFYSLDAMSVHPVELPTYPLETMAFWITPPEELVRKMVAEGLDVQKALMGIGYAVRQILPLFIQCETLDFSHSSCTAVNAPWHTVFVYERYPHGLGFTEQAFEILADIILAAYDRIRSCDCRSGCPCCVGKPLRGDLCWNYERGEANIPSKRATLRLLRGIIGDGTNLRNRDSESLRQDEPERLLLLERGLRRRLERLGDPEVFHPIDSNPQVGFPAVEAPAATTESDRSRRAFKRMRLLKSEQDLAGKLHPLYSWGRWSRPPDYLSRPSVDASAPPGISRQTVGPEGPDGLVSDQRRVAKDRSGTAYDELQHERAEPSPRAEPKALRDLLKRRRSGHRPPEQPAPSAVEPPDQAQEPPPRVVQLGDSTASRARKLRKRQP